MPSKTYSCETCPGFCCSYDEIFLTDADLARLGEHLSTDAEGVITRFTKYGMYKGKSRYPLMLKHKADKHFGTICTFFDTDLRRCTIYDARPAACRDYPHGPKCGYFEFLQFERRLQDDDTYVAVT